MMRAASVQSQRFVPVACYGAEAELAVQSDRAVIRREHVQAKADTPGCADHLLDRGKGSAREPSPAVLGQDSDVVKKSLLVVAVDPEPDIADSIATVCRQKAQKAMTDREMAVG